MVTREYPADAGWLPRVALTLVAPLAVAACGSIGGGSTLPPPPDLAGQTPAVVAHVRGAYDAAAAAPGSAATVGALCRAYHADLLFDAAARCYDRLTALDGDWRWRYHRALIDIELGGAEGLADRLREVAARSEERRVGKEGRSG